ncbi:IMP cyclohydrolase [Methanocaldococcus indicus]|uniref:IMP cyclohydrolase n=1 Tax=Methanocaldococcus indicus TaxID=213231 RepID=UPI003C6D9426
MYIGRFLVVGKTKEGNNFLAYRVSSRSFPNRIAKIFGNSISIIPKNLDEIFKNPYICYNCIKVVDNVVVGSNGSHTDFIAEKLHYGYRDALASVLLSMDYEKDEYGTPRIAGIVDKDRCFLGYVKEDSIRVAKFNLKESGIGYYLGVYNSCKITKKQKIEVPYNSAEEIAEYILNYKDFEHPVACGVALIKDNDVELAVKNKN